MNILDNEHVIMFDVDDTLVMWPSKKSKKNIKLRDPYLNKDVFLTPNKRHIALLKTHKVRGYLVVVWSAAGFKWAQEVVKRLGLNNYVDLIMSKPTKFVDDLQAHEVLGTRVYLK